MERENQKFFNDFFCSKTNKLKHLLVPSLQHVTMVKIAIELWNQIDLRESIVNYRLKRNQHSSWKEWREIEEKALDKVAQLPLPEVLKKDFLSVISPIGLQIKNWWRYHRYKTGLSILPNRFSWTSRGTIDRVKTAECLLNSEDMEVNTRYRLTCMYCMEDVIPEAWKQLDEDRKQFYYTVNETGPNRHLKFRFFLNFWAYKLKGETSKLKDHHTANCLVFYNAIWMGNKMAAEFFLDGLTDKEKDDRLGTLAWMVASPPSRVPFFDSNTPKEFFTKVLLFLLARISEVKKKEIFEIFPYKMLECLLDWPNRPLFVELAERTLRSIDNDQHYGELMLLIIKDIANGWTDCTSRQLFHYFWNLCPLSYKRRAIEGIDYYTVMKLYEGNDVEIIRALFQHACAKERKILIMCSREIDISARAVLKRKGWEPMEEVVVKFRTEFCKRNKERKT